MGGYALFSDITKANVGLSNADNTSDANKPVSTLQAAAIAAVDPSTEFKKTQIATPTTGQTVNMTSGKTLVIINPAGALLALTLNIVAGAYDGQPLDIVFTQIITTLTLTGSTLLTSIGNPVVGTHFRARWSSTLTKWI